MSFGLPLLSSRKKSSNNGPLENFMEYFHSLEGTEDFPLNLSVASLNELEDSAENEEELIFYLLEDIIFTSLYATFYEELFLALRDNGPVAISLIEEFSHTSEERDQKIALQTEDHLNFVQRGGICEGCQSCENHNDVFDLVEPWENRNFDFFVALYLGM